MSVLEAKRVALVERLSLTINMLLIRQKEEPVHSERQRIGENIAIADQLLGELHKWRWVNESSEASVQVALINGAALVTAEAIKAHGLGAKEAEGIVAAFIGSATKAIGLETERGGACSGA